MAKYMFYSGSAALTGCVAGFALGTFLFPKVIWYAYGMLYKMDSLVYVFDWKLAVISVIVSLLCSIGTTFVSVRRELTEVAAEPVSYTHLRAVWSTGAETGDAAWVQFTGS